MKRNIFRKVAAGIYHKVLDCKNNYRLFLKKSSKLDYINIGAGVFARKKWAVLDFSGENNFYSSSRLKFIDHDINLMETKRWDIPDNKFELAYCSCTIEHFPNKESQHLLNETYRILKKGSIFRVVAPDITLALLHYKNKDLEWFESCYGKFAHLPKNKEYALEHYLLTFFSTKKVEVDNIDLEQVRIDFNNMWNEDFLKKYISKYSYEHSNHHINWFDKFKLAEFLKESGFKDIQVRKRNDSDAEEFHDKDFDTTIPQMSLFMECKK